MSPARALKFSGCLSTLWTAFFFCLLGLLNFSAIERPEFRNFTESRPAGPRVWKFLPDGQHYWRQAAMLGESIENRELGLLDLWTEGETPGIVRIYAAWFSVFGGSAASLAALHGCLLAFLFFILRHLAGLLLEGRSMLPALTLVLGIPSALFHFLQPGKELIYVVAQLLLLVGVMGLLRWQHPLWNILAIVFGLCLSAGIRPGSLFLTLPILGCCLLWWLLCLKTGWGIGALLLILLLFQLDPVQRMASALEHDLQRRSVRFFTAHSSSTTHLQPWESDGWDSPLTVPVTLFKISLLEPHPQRWTEPGRRVGLTGRWISGVEMMVIGSLSLLALFARLFHGERALGALWITIVLQYLLLPLAVANVGALYRLRYTAWIIIALLGLRGLELCRGAILSASIRIR